MTILNNLKMNFLNEESFTLNEANDSVLQNQNVNTESIRARIYEAIDKGVLERVARGVFRFKDCLLIQGNGRDLSFIKDNSIDAIITDHPYDLIGNKGGGRNFANTYDCFKYNQEDFNEKARVLKPGAFLVEFLPEESGDNWEYLTEIKMMAKEAGLKYYSKVPWKKGDFISNCGRKSKNTEDVLFFTKGKARNLRPDAKKNKKDGTEDNFMSGAYGMLPTVFDFAKTNKKDTIHQAEKPVGLLKSIIEYVTKIGEIVVDQFSGSGVLGVAANEMNRKSILIEIDDENIDKIKRRLNL